MMARSFKVRLHQLISKPQESSAMNTEKENLIDPDSPDSIIKAAAKAYSEIWYNDEFFTLNSLAKKLNLSAADLIRHFGSRSGLLIEMLNYVQNICERKVFTAIINSRYKGIRRVVHFLKLVHQLLAEYPESAYWFKAYFSSDVVLTAAYPYLIKFYERWQCVIGQMLEGIVPNKLAEKIAVIYVDVLKACLLNSSGGSAISDIFPAKFFLFKGVGRILQGEFD